MIRLSAASLSLLLLLVGCRREKPVMVLEEGGGEAPWAARPARKTVLPPPKPREAPEPAAAAPRGVLVRSASEKKRLAPPEPRTREPMRERFGGEPLGAEASTRTASGPAGPPPDEASVRGEPEVRQTDELAAEPADRPVRYVSPAPLKKVLEPMSAADAAAGAVRPGAEIAPVEVSASPAGFTPAATAPLDDRVPDTVVADPTELGSYHVQVSSSPSFGSLVFNKEYPFMANIDLKTDLAAQEVKPGQYWIRYAVVDLLGFEHPFSKPKHIVLKSRPR